MISSDSLNRFKEIYRQEYGENLDDEKAYDLASNLVSLYRSVYLPKTNINQEYETQLQTTPNKN